MQQLLDPELPTRGEHVSILFCYLPISVSVKAFWLCVSAAPDSLAWALCF